MMPMDMRPESVQKMMLAPKMLLSMHVLQLNIMDLRVFMEAELEENPLLDEELQEISLDKDEAKLDEELTELIDEDVKDEELLAVSGDEVRSIDEKKRRYFESLITKRESLYDHLLWQLEVLAKDGEEKRIGEFIIGSLDDRGFLSMDLEQMQELINADIRSFRHALTLVRSFDPVGVAARNLKESLLMQLVFSGKGDTHLYRIVYLHLEDLERGNYRKIAKALSIPIKEVESAKRRLSYFNPRPAATFGMRETVSAIEPDVLLEKNNGTYIVEVNEQGLPKLAINRYYKGILKEKNAPESAKEYIKKKLSSALWLIGALKQRRKTIARVCEYLAKVQKDFLQYGDIAAKPLTLKRVANELSISEATVSRVVVNKYVQMVNGSFGLNLFPLKHFFAGHLKTVDGKFVSGRSVKQRIQDLVGAEDVKVPLSDEKIASIFKKEGIKISRRTVTKYRESLKIPPFNLRKKL